MLKRLVPTLLLAALALPGTAAANSLEIEGPTKVRGKGVLRAELSMESPSATRAVVVGGRLGAVRFVDLAGDMRVACKGRGQMRSGKTEDGHAVVVCRGKGGRAKVHGSKFRILLVARQYGLLIPEGVKGRLQGTFRTAGEEVDRREGRADSAEARRAELEERRKALEERRKEAQERKGQQPEPPADEEGEGEEELSDEEKAVDEELEEALSDG